jgi:hypothetical protein
MVNLITARPHVGFLLTAVAPLSGILTFLKVLTPILGFAGAALGVAAGIITLLIKIREYKQSKQKTP